MISMGARLPTGRRWAQYERQKGSGDLGEQRGVTLITVRTQSSFHGEDPVGLLISEAEAQRMRKPGCLCSRGGIGGTESSGLLRGLILRSLGTLKGKEHL